ncbi:MAG: MAPEG family protein [Deltaproteobacteria bacterium]|nr:MAPEG family protein [Deltaproteobacteria bacterium]
MIYVPYCAILAAFLLIYIPRQVVSAEMKKQEGGYNNNEPRVQQARLEGLGRRAMGAHNNAFEAFAPFAAGVLAAMQRSPQRTVIVATCIAFVVARTIYMVAYLADRANLRSGMWGLGMLAIATLMTLAIIG